MPPRQSYPQGGAGGRSGNGGGASSGGRNWVSHQNQPQYGFPQGAYGQPWQQSPAYFNQAAMAQAMPQGSGFMGHGGFPQSYGIPGAGGGGGMGQQQRYSNSHGSGRSRYSDQYAPSGNDRAGSSSSYRNEHKLSPSPPLSEEERKVRDLVAAVDRLIIKRRDDLIWSKADSDAFSNLLKELERLKEYSSKKKTTYTLIQAFGIMTSCKAEGRLDPSQKSRTTELRENLVNGIYDLCEDGGDKARKLGYLAIDDLSKKDKTLVKRNADVLVQLLQNDEPAEHDRIAESLVEHLRIAPLESFDVIIQDHCKGELRTLALSFLASPKADKVLEEVVVGVAENESALAARLADVIPLANQEEMELIKLLLQPLQTLWLPSFDFATTTEYEEASTSASSLLTKLVEGFIVRFSTASSGGNEEEAKEAQKIATALSGLQQASPLEMKDAEALFKSLLDVSTTGIRRDAMAKPSAPKSAASVYIKDLLRCVQFGHIFLPLTSTDGLSTSTRLQYFSAVLRIRLIRFVASVSSRSGEAAQRAPQELGFHGDQVKKDLATGVVEAINELFREGPPAAGDGQVYDILLAEALLSVLVQAEPPTRASISRPANPVIESAAFKSRLRHLYGLSQEIKSTFAEEGVIREAGRNVFDMAREYLKPGHLRSGVHLKPDWLNEVAPFPTAEQSRKREREADIPIRTKPERRAAPQPRGRGGARAPRVETDRHYSDDDLFAGTSKKQKSGEPSLSIKGAAREQFSIKGGASRQASAKVSNEFSIKGAASGSAKVVSSDASGNASGGISIQGAAAKHNNQTPPTGPRAMRFGSGNRRGGRR